MLWVGVGLAGFLQLVAEIRQPTESAQSVDLTTPPPQLLIPATRRSKSDA